MKTLKTLAALTVLFFLSSCYNAQVVTDKSPSSQVIEKPWAHSFIYGLVPPQVVETASECPNGLAKVDTKISFLNGLASSITFGLYTPMHITVTCASGSRTALHSPGLEEPITIVKSSSLEEKAKTMQKATEKAKKTGRSVYVSFK